MGITPNGYIAKSDGNSEWTSEEDLRGFHEKINQIAYNWLSSKLILQAIYKD